MIGKLNAILNQYKIPNRKDLESDLELYTLDVIAETMQKSWDAINLKFEGQTTTVIKIKTYLYHLFNKNTLE